MVIIDALLPCHHTKLISDIPHVWEKIAKHLQLVPKNIIAQHIVHFRKVFIQEYINDPVSVGIFRNTILYNS